MQVGIASRGVEYSFFHLLTVENRGLRLEDSQSQAHGNKSQFSEQKHRVPRPPVSLLVGDDNIVGG